MGLELPDCLIWRGWEPGNHYAKKLVVKNTSTQWIILQHKPNTTSFFDYDHPGSVKIPPGMQHVFIVTFRPTTMMEHHDTVS